MKRLKKLSFISLLCALCMMLFAFAACADDSLKYELISNGTDIKYYAVDAVDTDIEGDIVVPSTHDGIEVRVKSNAFKKCYKIKSITLSEGITHAYEGAFAECSVSEINVPHSIEYFCNPPFAVNSYGEHKNLTINYAGTITEWRSIKGAPDASYFGIKVICSDGIAVDTTTN